jgi:hypothetical protein
MTKFEVLEASPPTLEEAQAFVEGLVEILDLKDGSQLLFNEEGKLENLEINKDVIDIMVDNFGPCDMIVGNVLHLKGKARWR